MYVIKFNDKTMKDLFDLLEELRDEVEILSGACRLMPEKEAKESVSAAIAALKKINIKSRRLLKEAGIEIIQ